MGFPIAKHWSRWTLFLAFWTLIGLSFAIHFFLNSSKAGRSVSWSEAVTFSLADWYVFAVLSIPVATLARRFAFERRSWGRVAVVHIIYSVLFSFAFMALRAAVGHFQSLLSPGTGMNFGRALPLLMKTFQYNIWVYWVILSVCHAFDYYEKFHERELRASELEKRLAQARLQALQSQMNPHFLFNTLHTISALMHKDVEAADRMVMKLSDLLRRALDNTTTHEVALSDELDFLQRYLEIEKTRFRERLNVEMDIAPETVRARVPNLVLQPLVENAIRHGIERHARPGRIILRAHRRESRLELEVQDNGDGIPAGGPKREGIGLSNTRSRLQQLYGKDQKFELQNVPTGGLLARVVIPFQTA
ncbi:MAG TPA: histidine kinase [Verrucomicrobiae bacterium]|nr:histidine kinase [Verrucomicrobiae bacterium]